MRYTLRQLEVFLAVAQTENVTQAAELLSLSQSATSTALKELEQIVRALESGDAKLDDAISSYERGAALKKHCEAKLTDAKNRVERISFSSDGNDAKTEPAQIG